MLMVYGGGSIFKNGVYEEVTTILQNGGIEYIELGGIDPNPRIASVREGAKICKENNIDVVLAVGGGSTVLTIDIYRDIPQLLHQIPMQTAWDCVRGSRSFWARPFQHLLSFSLQSVCKYACMRYFAFDYYSIAHRLNQYNTISDRKILWKLV